jgi:myo-inositol-1(or 4)-monophosphatase
VTNGDAVFSDHELAIAAASAGAAVVRKRFGGALVRFDKGGGDFATEADIEAEEAVLRILREARPEDAVSGEESGLSGAVSAERTWLVDPLCGTLNYATGNMAVAVNVALRVGSTVTAAAVADPFTGEVFWTGSERVDGGQLGSGQLAGGQLGGGQLGGEQVGGRQLGGEQVARESVSGESGSPEQVAGGQGSGERVSGEQGSTERVAGEQDSSERVSGEYGGGGAFLRLPDGVDVPLRPSAVPPLVDVNLDAPYETGPAYPGARLISAPEFLDRFRPRVLSTTLALTWVAAGRRAAYVTAGDLRDNVHFSAGIALCRAAGCVVTALDGGPVATTATDAVVPNGILAAADPDTHRELLTILNS